MKVNEIEVVENMIRLLNECLTISLKNKRKDEVKAIRNDIELCKSELKKLMDQREAAKNIPGELKKCSDIVKQNNVFSKM